MPCMMLENVCYNQGEALTLLCAWSAKGSSATCCTPRRGYQHVQIAASPMFTGDGKLTWRGEHCAAKNGNLYPTHPIGPIAQWMDINRVIGLRESRAAARRPPG